MNLLERLRNILDIFSGRNQKRAVYLVAVGWNPDEGSPVQRYRREVNVHGVVCWVREIRKAKK